MARLPALLALAALLLAGCTGPGPLGGGPWDPDSAPLLPARVRWTADLPYGMPGFSSPLLVDLDGDRVLDVVAGNGEGHRGADGAFLGLSGRGGRVLWNATTGVIDSSAVVGDVTGDRRPDLVVGARVRLELLVVGLDGEVQRGVGLGNWVHTPALVDVDGDGTLDVVAVTGGLESGPLAGSGKAGELVVLRGGALEPVWRRNLTDEAYSSPAVGDPGDGRLLVLHGLGGQLRFGGGFEARDARTGALAWREDTRTGVLSSPPLADLDGDGLRDVVFLTWWGEVHARRATDGQRLWDAATQALTWTSPALGDLDGDGRPDVVVAGYRSPGLQFERFDQPVNGKHSLAKGNAGLVVAYHGATGRELWRREVAMTVGSPVTADVTGDGRAEVLVVAVRGDKGFFGERGAVLVALDGASGAPVGRVPLPSGVVGTPAVGDLDGDGKPEVVLVASEPAMVLVVGLDTPSEPRVPWSWPRWRGDERGTGVGAG